jgi:enolase-phosphatase E1
MKAIVTDIEGTTSSISFVHKTLFPYARQRMESFLREHSSEAEVIEALTLVRATILSEKLAGDELANLLNWIDTDRKHPGLKALQGHIWRVGYENGEIKGHVYADVRPKLDEWSKRGIALAVYSSGSVLAQRLLFGHSIAGDLNSYFSHNFDTAIGGKREANSYRAIVDALGIAAFEIAFLSDIPEELDAAAEIGMKTYQLDRGEGVAPASSHALFKNFSELPF